MQVRASRFGAFRHRDFTIFWTGLFVSHTGSWMQSVALGWLMYDLTGSPIALGSVSIVRAVATSMFLAVGGTLADRLNRAQVMLCGQGVVIVTCSVLGVLVVLLYAAYGKFRFLLRLD